MPTLPNTSESAAVTDVRLTDRLWAAFIFFTRLPLWRLYEPPKEAYATVVEHWPLTGWLTGGLAAVTLYFGACILSWPLAILAAVAVRLLLTGALHEDGLADFFDGMGGGGRDRQHILAIMKDSHIGTYGVLGLILYLSALFYALYAMSPALAALCLACADPAAKMLSSQLIRLPYARSESTAKNRTVYRPISPRALCSLLFQGLLPVFCCLWQSGALAALGLSPVLAGSPEVQLTLGQAILLPAVPLTVFLLLFAFVRRRLQGYTGDCCGAVFLLTELSLLLTASICLVW